MVEDEKGKRTLPTNLVSVHLVYYLLLGVDVCIEEIYLFFGL